MIFNELVSNFVSSIREDYKNGSIEIVKNALLGLKKINQDISLESEKFNFLLDELKNAKPSMHALKNSINLIQTEVESKGLAFLNQILDNLLAKIETSSEKTIRNAIDYVSQMFRLGDLSILTTSYSSTALKFFETLSKLRKIQIFVLKSRWKNFDYSKSTFKKCIEQGIATDIVDNDKLEILSSKTSFAITGADCICPKEGIVNGIPTKHLAEFCFERKIPYFVLAESIKFSEKCTSSDGFDWVDIKFVTQIFTDNSFSSLFPNSGTIFLFLLLPF